MSAGKSISRGGYPFGVFAAEQQDQQRPDQAVSFSLETDACAIRLHAPAELGFRQRQLLSLILKLVSLLKDKSCRWQNRVRVQPPPANPEDLLVLLTDRISK